MGSTQSSHIESGFPEPRGPHHVGFVDVMMNDYAERGLFVRLHYPIRLKDGEKPEYTMPWLAHEKLNDGFADVMGINRTVFKWMMHYTRHNLDNIKIPAVHNAVPFTDNMLVPIIFSHGVGGARFANTAMSTELASHGFLVVNVEHRDQSACLTYHITPEGTEQWVWHNKQPYPDPTKPWLDEDNWSHYNVQITHRRKECIAAADFLADLNKGVEIKNILGGALELTHFKDKIDLGRLAIAGHSFGGATGVETCGHDPRFKVGVGFDAIILPMTRKNMDRPTQPLLFINTVYYPWFYNMRHKQRIIEAGKTFSPPVDRDLVTIKDTVHFDQCDIPFLVGPGFVTKQLGLTGDMCPYLCHKINMDLTIGFLRRQLGIKHHETFEDVLNRYSNFLIHGTHLDMENHNWEDEAHYHIEQD